MPRLPNQFATEKAIPFAAALLPVVLLFSSPGLTATGKSISGVAVDQPLRTWLEEISRRTGVRHRTAADYEDRGITYRVRELTDRQVREAIASLYRDLWSRREARGVSTWTLTASRARLEAERKVVEGYEAALARGLLDIISETAKHGPAPWILEDQPPDGLFAKQCRQVALALQGLSLDQIGHLLEGEVFRVMLRDVDAGSGKPLWDLVKNFALSGDDPGGEQARANAWIQFSSRAYSLPHSHPDLPLHDVFVKVGVFPGGWNSGFNVVTNADLSRARLLELLSEVDAPPQSDEARRREGGASIDLRVPDDGRFKEPLLHSRAAVLTALAERLDLQLIADSITEPPAKFAGAARLKSRSIVGTTLAEALDQLAVDFRFTWRVEKGIYLVRSAIWPLNDRAEPPAYLAAQWARALEETGRLSLDDSAAIAGLSPIQRYRLSWRLPEVHRASSPWLQFYSTLTSRQRKASRSRDGLQFWTSDPAARRRLEYALEDAAVGGRPEVRETVRRALAILTVTVREPAAPSDGKARTGEVFWFDLTPVADRTGAASGAPHRWLVNLPVRQPVRKSPDAMPAPPAPK